MYVQTRAVCPAQHMPNALPRIGSRSGNYDHTSSNNCKIIHRLEYATKTARVSNVTLRLVVGSCCEPNNQAYCFTKSERLDPYVVMVVATRFCFPPESHNTWLRDRSNRSEVGKNALQHTRTSAVPQRCRTDHTGGGIKAAARAAVQRCGRAASPLRRCCVLCFEKVSLYSRGMS